MTNPKYPLVMPASAFGWTEIGTDTHLFAATHMVVPVGAVVIERDENGEWPHEFIHQFAKLVADRLRIGSVVGVHQSVRILLDALPEGETQ